jgi:hypothetical protein
MLDYMCRILKSKFTAGWAGILQCRPGYIMLRPDYSLLGRHMKSPSRNIARLGQINALSRLGRNLSIRLVGIHSRVGRVALLSIPARRASLLPRRGPQPRLGQRPPALAGPAHSCPGWASAPLHSPAGPAIPFRPPSPQRPAGPDQEDPAWPGFFTRPPSLSPGWAG